MYMYMYVITLRMKQDLHVILFQDSQTVCARQVIVAVPPSALHSIDFTGFTNVDRFHQSLSSLQPFPVLRIFFIYSHDWWSSPRTPVHLGHDVITDLPLRHVRYVAGPRANRGKIAEKHVWMVAEAEGDDVSYFRQLMRSTTFDADAVTTCNDTQPLVHVITRHLATLFDLEARSVPSPETVFVHEAGEWYVWRQGVQWESVANFLQKPFDDEDVFFTSGALCGGTCQLSAEGAIKNVDDVMNRFLESTVAYRVQQEREER